MREREEIEKERFFPSARIYIIFILFCARSQYRKNGGMKITTVWVVFTYSEKSLPVMRGTEQS